MYPEEILWKMCTNIIFLNFRQETPINWGAGIRKSLLIKMWNFLYITYKNKDKTTETGEISPVIKKLHSSSNSTVECK